jgi:hypothetical protein
MNTESIQVAADHYARFYHEEPDDATAGRDAQGMLRTDQLIAARDALAELLATDMPDGAFQEFVRRHANRLAFDDEHARRFVQKTVAALDDELRTRGSES